MASSSKKKTTMAKLNRETAVRERRLRKLDRKEARKREAAALAAEPAETGEPAELDETAEPAVAEER